MQLSVRDDGSLDQGVATEMGRSGGGKCYLEGRINGSQTESDMAPAFHELIVQQRNSADIQSN